MILTVIIFIAVLALLVLVHELGHFLAARLFGVKAEEFGIGFPPRLFGWYKKDGRWRRVWGSKQVKDAPGTVYSLNWVPLGGFVKIKGENGEEKSADSFGSQPAWQRALILAAGVLMNIVLAAFILTIGLMIGLPQEVNNLPARVKVGQAQIQILEVMPNMPGASAGLQVGDFIVDINDQQFSDYKAVQNFVADKEGQSLVYTIKRGQEIFDKTIVPAPLSGTDRAGIGVGIADIAFVRYPWYLAIVKGVSTTFWLLVAIFGGLFSLLARLFTGHSVASEVAGPVGIANMTGQMVEMGWIYLLQFTALLSLNLAVINILPIPALDGGRLIFLALEKIRRKPMRQEIEAAVHNIFFILLIVLILIITFKDVSKLGCLTCQLKSWLNM